MADLFWQFICTYLIIRHNKENMLEIGDIASPALALGYCFRAASAVM